jgi:DNA repair exonuclease SbcCD ATPase subunit
LAQDKVYVDSSYRHAKNQARIEKEEKELEALMNKSEVQEEEEEIQEEEEEEVQEDVQTKEPEEDDEVELSREEKTFKKRYGDLRRHMSEKEKEWEATRKELENKGTKVTPPKSDEDIEAWSRKYPDIAAIVQTIAEKKAKELFSKAETRLQEFDEAQYEVKRTKAETQIRKAHEDFDELRASDDFHNWADEQPSWVQNALYENSDDAPSVIRVIDLYKVDKGMTPSARKQKVKEATKTIKTSTAPKVDSEENGKKIRESDVAKMSDKQFEEKWEAIKEAQATGNFIYDLSGGTR